MINAGYKGKATLQKPIGRNLQQLKKSRTALNNHDDVRLKNSSII